MIAAEILRTLVAIPTPSSVSNLPLIEWVTQFVEARNWGTQRFDYTDDNGVAKANLIARPINAPSAGSPSTSPSSAIQTPFPTPQAGHALSTSTPAPTANSFTDAAPAMSKAR